MSKKKVNVQDEKTRILIETLKEIAKGTYSQSGAVRAAKEALAKINAL